MIWLNGAYMPGWKLHTFSGLIVTTILIMILYTALDSGIFGVPSIDLFAIMVAGFACILGSLMPDYDYRKTMIRHIFGPVFGAFITFGYLYTRGPKADLEFALVIFISIVVIFAIIGILPMKHHGKLHSLTAAAFFGLGWIILSIIVLELTHPFWIAVIAMFAIIGYTLHLALDLDLKL
jgi:hypothetical protein